MADPVRSRAASFSTAEGLSRLSAAPSTTVVIPVYNGGAAVRRCIESVVRWTPGTRIVVIDDCSTDPAVLADLAAVEATGDVQVLRHEENRGYTRTANHALHLDDQSDVVLLNSDTEVGPLWLSGLRGVAASSERPVATVSAVSDNAGAMAMPEPGVANAWPEHLSWPEIARGVARADLPLALETPTGHGFCMLVTRAAIRTLGGFDEAAFPRGYGEENDFCMRAREVGMVNLLAPRVMVRHERSQSFGSAREELIRAGRAVVDERHPTYTAEVRAWMSSTDMTGLRRQFVELRSALAGTDEVRPARMYVIHKSGGGTPATNADLMSALGRVQDGYLVEAEANGRLTLFSMQEGQVHRLEEWRASSPYRLTDTYRHDYAEAVAGWITALGVELVHARHLINQPLTSLSEVCRRLGVRFVLSTHDFYMVCPSVHLLDERRRFCGGHCTPGSGTCWTPTAFVAQAPPLKHRWIHEWQRRAGEVFDSADAVIATTESARSIIASSYPAITKDIRIIEHGRDASGDWTPVRTAERAPGPLRVVAVANWAEHKGVDYLKAVAGHVGDTVEFHVFGKDGDQLADVGAVHGTFERETFPALMRELDPDLVALVSIWPETYSHTLTEAWALGVPVLCTDIGAVADRVRHAGGGVTVPVDDPAAAAEVLRSLAEEPARTDLLRGAIPRHAIRSRTAMAEDYHELYEGFGSRRPVVGYVVPSAGGRFTGAAHVRVLGRLRSAGVASRVLSRRVMPEEVVRTGTCDVDVLLVQRCSLPAGLDLERFLDVVRAAGSRLVVEIDDDVISPASLGRLSADPVEDEWMRASTLRVLRAADQVLVSTPALAGVVHRLAPDRSVVVVPNALDGRLWGREVPPSVSTDDTTRILYFGSRTHDEDLALLDEVVPALGSALGRPVELELLGVFRNGAPPWASPRGVPVGHIEYPRFVPWLRAQAHAQRWAVGVAPLVESSFNDCKSDLKLLEYAGLGLPSVASDVGPYRGSPLATRRVENTPRAWLDALVGLLAEPHDGAGRQGGVPDARWMGSSEGLWLEALVGSGVRSPVVPLGSDREPSSV